MVLWAIAEMKNNGELMEENVNYEEALTGKEDAELGIMKGSNKDDSVVMGGCGVVRRGSRLRRLDEISGRVDRELQHQLRTMLNLCLTTTRAHTPGDGASLPPGYIQPSSTHSPPHEGQSQSASSHDRSLPVGGDLSASISKLSLHTWSHKELAMALYSCRKLGMIPPSQWLQAAVLKLTAVQLPGLVGESLQKQHGGELMTFRDVATAAHGLAGIIKLAAPKAGSSSRAHRVTSVHHSSASPLLAGTASSSSSAVELPSSALTLKCAVHLLRCAAAMASSASARELAMFMSALPILLSSSASPEPTVRRPRQLIHSAAVPVLSGGGRGATPSEAGVNGATGRVKEWRKNTRVGTTRPRGGTARPSHHGLAESALLSLAAGQLLPDVPTAQQVKHNMGLLLSAYQCLLFTTSNPSHDKRDDSSSAVESRMRMQEVVAVPLAAAKLGLKVGSAFCQDVTTVFMNAPNLVGGSNIGNSILLPQQREQQADSSSTLLLPDTSPSCRDWVSALWALERIQPHSRSLLQTPQGVAWLSTACKAILLLLRRTSATSTSSATAGADVTLPMWAPRPGWKLSIKGRQRMIASERELRLAASSATMLGSEAVRMLAVISNVCDDCIASVTDATAVHHYQADYEAAAQVGLDDQRLHAGGSSSPRSTEHEQDLRCLSRLLMLASWRMKQICIRKVKVKRCRLRMARQLKLSNHLG
jgi:hypothetical protein